MGFNSAFKGLNIFVRTQKKTVERSGEYSLGNPTVLSYNLTTRIQRINVIVVCLV